VKSSNGNCKARVLGTLHINTKFITNSATTSCRKKKSVSQMPTFSMNKRIWPKKAVNR
jgi:hypothetical protein